MSILLVFSCSLVFATEPEIVFDETSYNSGIVDIEGQVSSGVELDLFLNEVKVDSKVIVPNRTVVLLSDGIKNLDILIGQSIVFQNDNPSSYMLNISDYGVLKTLEYGDEYIFTGTVVEEIEYREESSGDSAKINVEEGMVDFIFEEVNDNLLNGDNDLKFVAKYPYLDYSESVEFEYVISFEQYVNDIVVTNYTNVTSAHEIQVLGYVSTTSYPLYYVVNMKPSEVGNIGALNSVELDGDKFNITVDNLVEGENDIYFITTDADNSNIFNGVKKIEVFVDSIPPKIEIVTVQYEKGGNVYEIDLDEDVYINGAKLLLEIDVDSNILNYTYNNKTYSEDVINNTINLSLSLEKGLNALTLEAIDQAGNKAKVAHNIYFDDTKPDMVDDSLEPEDVFDNGVSHFFFQAIEGTVDRGDVEVTIFTIPQGSETSDGTRVNCGDYEELFLRNLGQSNDESQFNDSQISLTNLMFQKVTVDTDSDGEFEALIGLQEKDYDIQNDNKIDSVKSENLVCFIMVDRYGNVGHHSESVQLDSGNTMWKVGEISTYPNTIYAGEIESSGDVKEGNGGVGFDVYARFYYIGGGDVNHITSISVKKDSKFSEDSKHINIDTSNLYWSYTEDTKELLVYFPIEVNPLGKDPLDYPDDLKFGFSLTPTYTVGDENVPIDTTNPVYFQTTINIESPLDATKWLTPEMIDDWVGFLNQSIEYTQTATEWLGYASVGGVLACTGTRFWYTYQKTFASEEQLKEAKKTMFQVCDRVMCLESPDDCLDSKDEFFDVSSGKNSYNRQQLDTSGNAQFVQDSEDPQGNAQKLLGRITSLQVLNDGKPVKDDTHCMFDGVPGVYVSADVKQYQSSGSKIESKFTSTEQESDQYLKRQCVKADWSDGCTFAKDGTPNEGCTLQGVDLQGISSVCFQEGEPNYDETKCPALGIGDPLKGWDPNDGLIESVGCGCITDTYSHLKNWLKIQKSIRGCLQQAKIGEVEGSYCEKLMGIYVCDIATNALFKANKIMDIAEKTKTEKESPDTRNMNDQSFFDLLENSKEGDQILNDRYQGTFYSQVGLGTDQVVNKVCLGAISGDWSSITDNLLTSIDENQVDPTFGPMLASSRMQGINPFTGELTVQYRFTYAAVSGGQSIKSEVELYCDSNKPGGEYCLEGTRYSSKQAGSDIETVSLYVSEDGSKQDAVVLNDKNAKYRYNVIRITHTYEVDGKTITKPYEEEIFHKDELSVDCYFSGGVFGVGLVSEQGISCGAKFSDTSLVSMYKIEDKSHFAPRPDKKTAVYYPGSHALYNLYYKIQDNAEGEQSSFDLHYLVTCSGIDDGKYYRSSKNIDTTIEGKKEGRILLDLFEIPELSSTEKKEDEKYSYKGYATFSFDDKGELNNPLKSLSILYRNKEKLPASFSIDGIYLNGQESKSVGSVVFKIDKEKGVVEYFENTKNVDNLNAVIKNLANKDESGVLIKEKFEVSFEIVTKYDLEDDVSFAFVRENDEVIDMKSLGQKTELDDSNKIENLVEGTCDVKFRILPSSSKDLVNRDNFETYSPVETSNNFSSDNLQNIKIHEDKFILKNKIDVKTESDKKDFWFEIITPQEDANICVKEGDKKITIPIEIVMQSNYDEIDYKYRVSSFEVQGVLEKYTVGVDFMKLEFIQSKDVKELIEGNYNLNLGDIELVNSEEVDLNVVYQRGKAKKERNDEINIFLSSCLQ